MTDRATLEALIARVLEGEGPDRELDFAIAAAFGWPDSPNLHQHARRYTESLDAALTLVSEGWIWLIGSYGNARVYQDQTAGKSFIGENATPARALIAACIKAMMEAQGE
jgi:hypothetical protein